MGLYTGGYYFEYYDTENVLNKCTIQKFNALPLAAEEINGYVSYNLSEVDDVDESIRGFWFNFKFRSIHNQNIKRFKF